MSTKQNLILKKIEVQMKEIGEKRFVNMQSMFPFTAMEDTLSKDEVHLAPPLAIVGGIAEKEDYFNGRDRYLWLHKEVEVPAAIEGMRACGKFDFGVTDGGQNSGFESLLYINQTPYQGVDGNHQEVMLDSYEGTLAAFTFLLWTGLEGGGKKREMEHRLRYAAIGYLHEAADELYYYLKAIVETVTLLPENDPAREVLIGAAEAALFCIDWDEDYFITSVSPALEALEHHLAQYPKQTTLTASCVGHTHIDVAWLWRLKHTREKSIRSFASVLQLMNEFDDYIFFQSQPQLYQYIKEDQPLLYEKIKQRVKEGRWEPDGGMWLEADCNISSGEALSRQFLYGIRFFEKEFGKSAVCLWLPDVFGYSWALPQIMKQCNIKTFMTTKISWNQFNSMPDDLFSWRGIDGSEVLTYFVDTPGERDSFEQRSATYNGHITPHSVLGSWHKFKNKDISKEVLIPFGYGDGGGGPTREMLRMRQVMDKLPGLPNVKPSRADDFFDRIHEKAQEKDTSLRTWDGELYLEYHRGTYTSQAKSKWWNRRIENELMETEMLCVLANAKWGSEEYSYPRKNINEAWEILLRNQFHDIIPGSSIREVYEDSHLEYEKAAKLLKESRKEAMEKLGGFKENHYTIYSPSCFERCEPVLLPEKRNGTFILRSNILRSNILPAQKTEEGTLVELIIPPLTGVVVEFQPDSSSGSERLENTSPFQVDMEKGILDTPYYIIEFTSVGEIKRLYDKKADREALKGTGNRLEIFEDRPIDYENWDIDIYHTQKYDLPEVLTQPEVIEQGGLRAVIRFTLKYRNSRFTQDMIVYANNGRIDFVTHADWRESRRLLKTAFDVNVRTTKASYDIQYGHVERPTHTNTSWDVARFEVVGHKWGDLSENGYGVSILNNCKYGYSANGNTMRLTLLKSGKFPDPEADMGEHDFTYSMLPHENSVVESQTLAEAAALNQPVRVFANVSAPFAAPVVYSSKKHAGIAVDAIKMAEDGDGYIVRVHECRGGSCTLTLQTTLPAVEIIGCNILEETIAIDDGKNVVYHPDEWNVSFTPFAIKTFRIRTH